MATELSAKILKQLQKAGLPRGGTVPFEPELKDRAHAGDPDHWDVQENGGKRYFRVDLNGNLLP